jgi:hypothetical protein
MSSNENLEPHYFIITRRDLDDLIAESKTIYGNEICERGILSVVDACEQNPVLREGNIFKLLNGD